jgi:hypothetical protein
LKSFVSAVDSGRVFVMATSAANPRVQAHELIERMTIGQVSAVVGLLEAMLNPVSVALANPPYDDEPVSEEEARAVAISKEWLRHNRPIPNEEVLAEYGLTSEDFERMGCTPLEPDSGQSSR